MEKYTKQDLQRAFNAGRESVKQNNDLDRLLDEGTKQAPERMTFDTWLNSIQCEEKSSCLNIHEKLALLSNNNGTVA